MDTGCSRRICLIHRVNFHVHFDYLTVKMPCNKFCTETAFHCFVFVSEFSVRLIDGSFCNKCRAQRASHSCVSVGDIADWIWEWGFGCKFHTCVSASILDPRNELYSPVLFVICLFRLFFCVNLALQIEQVKGLNPSWKLCTWVLSPHRCLNVLVHLSHWKLQIFVCDLSWLLRFVLFLNVFGQCWHS